MSQALTLEQCLRSVTIEAARQARMEDKLGTIEAGGPGGPRVYVVKGFRTEGLLI